MTDTSALLLIAVVAAVIGVAYGFSVSNQLRKMAERVHLPDAKPSEKPAAHRGRFKWKKYSKYNGNLRRYWTAKDRPGERHRR